MSSSRLSVYQRALWKYPVSSLVTVGNVVTQDTKHDSGVRASSDKTGKVLNEGANQFESHGINSSTMRNTNRNTIKEDKRKNNRSTAKHAVKSQNGGSDEEIGNLSLFQIYAK